ncbi:hybrid sensor histidine kinase/response regulator [Yeosuana marina]|uniref:hybrid sensor histidine kinase/response regulator n=1 Tax=Yeosuana marina TaxID=1565536 RepID=UPI00141F28F2|nr:PAS domain-containing hybrid sensor histidine kinase/response regulator [Yeosuana marina]
MNINEKTKEELKQELVELFQENNSLKVLKEKREAEFLIANKELLIQSELKEKRAEELAVANKELAFQSKLKEKRAEELIIANKELVIQSELKEKRAEELVIANKELAYQNKEKEKRAEELVIANKELVYQNRIKEKRAAELVIANKELVFQNQEKVKRAAELYLAQEIAEEFENKFKQIAEHIDDVFWLRTTSEMIYVSPSFEKIWGVRVDELYKNPEILTDKIHPEDKPNVQEIIQSKEFKDKGLFDYQYRIIQPNNQVRWINTKTFPIIDDSGKIVKRVGIARDITERFQNLQELVDAMKKAEQSDRLKSAFLANMSHEIRTPMNGILGFAGLLKEPNLSGEKQQEYIQIIEKSGVRMLNIINDIISISKIESGQMNLNISESNINDQIEYVYTFFKPEIEEKGMRFLIKNSLPLGKAIIKTDREKLFAIFTNLVKNAIKYTERGSIELGCNKKDEYLEFYVKDSGIGIDKDRQKAIFERFIQADISDKHAYQGAGLGLSISKAYIEMLGGKLWVESEKGFGSTFYFTIPYTSELKKQAISAIETYNDQTDNQIKNLKILIVEDDETSDLLISIMLTKMSRKILNARNGIEAIELCRNNPDIDLILMDIKMPTMDGYETTQQIRLFNEDVIIIAQTAFGLTGDRENAIAAGCNAYISKPIVKEELMLLLQQYFIK